MKKELEILLLNSIQTIYSRVLNLRVLLLFGGAPVELMLSRKKAIEITHTQRRRWTLFLSLSDCRGADNTHIYLCIYSFSTSTRKREKEKGPQIGLGM
jgi:hypothetical protein